MSGPDASTVPGMSADPGPHMGAFRAPIVWIDPKDGAQHCSCGWVRPATARGNAGQPSRNDIVLDLARAEVHANSCALHVAYLRNRVRAMDAPPDVIELLETLVATTKHNSRRTSARWLADRDELAVMNDA